MQITCTCGKRLRIEDDQAGKRVKCPACGEFLQLLQVVEKLPPARPKKRFEDDAVDDEPRPRRKRTKGPGISPVVWLALGGGGVLIVVLIAVLVVVLTHDRPAAVAGGSAGGQAADSKATVETATNVERIAYSRDGTRLATAIWDPVVSGGNPSIKIWDTGTGKPVMKLAGHAQLISDLAFSPDGKQLVSSCGQLNEVIVWDLATGAFIRKNIFPQSSPALGSRFVAFTPDGKSVVSIAKDVVAVIEPRTGNVDRHETFINFTAQAASSPTETIVAIAQIMPTKPVTAAMTVYDYGKRTSQTVPLKVAPSSMAYSADGRSLVMASADGPIQVFDTKTWTIRASFERTQRYIRAGLNADGTLMCGIPDSSGRPQAEIWPVGSKQSRQLAVGWCSDVAFAPDGKTVAVAIRDDTLKFVDLTTGQAK
jgi:WD40 repeat protein